VENSQAIKAMVISSEISPSNFMAVLYTLLTSTLQLIKNAGVYAGSKPLRS